MIKIGVLGAGTWGIALSRMLENSGHNVEVWSALPSEIDELNSTHKQKNLPNIQIPMSIKFTKSIKEVCTKRYFIVCYSFCFCKGNCKRGS